jgi:hypothetical protein
MTEFFHVSRRSDLTELRPSRFDSFGKMDHKAVFVTTRDRVGSWAAYIGEGCRELYIYRVLPGEYILGEGRDGASRGDFKIITDSPIPVEFIRSQF